TAQLRLAGHPRRLPRSFAADIVKRRHFPAEERWQTPEKRLGLNMRWSDAPRRASQAGLLALETILGYLHQKVAFAARRRKTGADILDVPPATTDLGKTRWPHGPGAEHRQVYVTGQLPRKQRRLHRRQDVPRHDRLPG